METAVCYEDGVVRDRKAGCTDTPLHQPSPVLRHLPGNSRHVHVVLASCEVLNPKESLEELHSFTFLY